MERVIGFLGAACVSPFGFGGQDDKILFELVVEGADLGGWGVRGVGFVDEVIVGTDGYRFGRVGKGRFSVGLWFDDMLLYEMVKEQLGLLFPMASED